MKKTIVIEEVHFDRLEKILSEALKRSLGENYYIISLAKKVGWEPYKMKSYLDNLDKLSPSSVFSILLKEIAIDFDNNHEGNIKDSKEIWVISLVNGNVVKVEKNRIKNYRNFAAFRSEEEAKKAKSILSKRLRKMFRGCGEK